MVERGISKPVRPRLMEQSNLKRKELGRVIDYGEIGKKVIFSEVEAALTFGISKDRFEQMAFRGHDLGIAARGGKVEVTLHGTEDGRRRAYVYLYGFVQNLNHPETLRQIVEKEIPRELLEAIPNFEATVACSGALPDEDYRLLAFQTYAFWLSLKDKGGLEDPLNVLSANC